LRGKQFPIFRSPGGRHGLDEAGRNEHNEWIKQAVVAGLGISFLSQHTLGLELSVGRLAVLQVEGATVMRRWFIAPDYLEKLAHPEVLKGERLPSPRNR
jgi:DNA-binding transcriptional LysR family regulator